MGKCKGLVLAAESVFREFLNTASALWSKYLEVGPGQLDPADGELLEEALRRIREANLDNAIPRDDWRTEFDAAVTTLEPLLLRCVTRPEGLCFVTGEAGLIPNRQQHEQCSGALQRLTDLVLELDSGHQNDESVAR